jgi:decaprenyl-diphosphate synthase subunit 1
MFLKNDLEQISIEIKQMLTSESLELQNLSRYYFDGSGKSIRPMIVCAMARSINMNFQNKIESTVEDINYNQRKIALIAEMIHVASLIHDDIIDNSDFRRGKESVNIKWGCNKAVFVGDYILAKASRSLAKIGNTRVVGTLTKVLEDLVQGELMQFGAKEYENERFTHYLTKTYRKTASLIANSCKAVAILSNKNLEEDIIDISFEFGKNIGIAFQLIDDVLDFTTNGQKLGKPCEGNDLKLGLATAPVLFAVSEYPQLNAMIMRRFNEKDDAKRAFELVNKSSGIEQTKHLASKYCDNAMSILNKLGESDATNYLKHLTNTIVNRDK